MRQYYNKRETAENHLHRRRLFSYDKYRKNNDKILLDSSRVSFGYKTYSLKGNYVRRLVWYVDMSIITESILKDLKDLGHIDIVNEIGNKLK